MRPKDSYNIWLDHLRVLYPLTGVLHIGAGSNGALERYKKWGVTTALFVEADNVRVEKISTELEGVSGWSVHHDLVAHEEGFAVFHQASNKNESGLVSPEVLTPLWQNLKVHEQHSVQATTIQALMDRERQGLRGKKVNWVWIDCLPALSILQGAGHLLEGFDVVVARTIFEEDLLPEQPELCKTALDQFMSKHGFLSSAQIEERHPAIGQVLYVRDWKDQMHVKLEQLHEERQTLTKELQEEIAEVAAQRDGLQDLAGQRQSVVEQLSQYRDELKSKLNVMQARDEQLSRSGAEQVALMEQRQQEIERLHKVLGERENTVIALTRQLAEAGKNQNTQKQGSEQQRLQLAQLTDDRDQQLQKIEAFEVQIAELTKDRDTQKRGSEQQCLQLAQLTDDRDQQLQKVEAFEVQIAELTADRDTQQQDSEQQRSTLLQLGEKHDEAILNQRDKIKNLSADISTMTERASHSEKRLLLRDGDLDNLRQKYKNLALGFEGQQTLLQEVQSKLLEASKYISQLAQGEKKKPIRNGTRTRKRPGSKPKGKQRGEGDEQ